MHHYGFASVVVPTLLVEVAEARERLPKVAVCVYVVGLAGLGEPAGHHFLAFASEHGVHIGVVS